jgi:hypothetical protein
LLFSEIVEAHKKGKIGSVITVESGHSIGTSLAVLRNDIALTSISVTIPPTPDPLDAPLHLCTVLYILSSRLWR